MTTEKIRYEVIGRAAVLTITRPRQHNAVDVQTAEGLLEAYHRFERDDTAKVLVPSAEGDESFCAGADLTDGPALIARLHEPGGTIGFTRFTSSKPSIAAISGWCLGAGMDLAVWCDLRVAAVGSTFGFVERRWGVPSIDGYSQRLPRLIGLSRSMDLLLTGRRIDAEEALAIGLVNEITSAGEHLSRALEIAEVIAGYPQPGLLATRRAALQAFDLPLQDGLALEIAMAAAPLGIAQSNVDSQWPG